jgi:hypothetical protein
VSQDRDEDDTTRVTDHVKAKHCQCSPWEVGITGAEPSVGRSTGPLHLEITHTCNMDSTMMLAG